MDFRITRSIATSLILAACLVPCTVLAATPISTCGATCSTDCELTNDLVCTSGTAVTLAGNFTNLDLKGHNIVCPGCDYAVKITTPHHKVFTSIHNFTVPGSKIVGNYFAAILCQGLADTRIVGLAVSAFSATAIISGCSEVADSLITDVPFVDTDGTVYRSPICIFHKPTANTDSIQLNTIDGCLKPIVRAPSGPATILEIIGNVINYRDPGASANPNQVAAIYLAEAVPKTTDLINNIIVGNSPNALVAKSPNNQLITYSNNICDFHQVNCVAAIAAQQFSPNGIGTCFQ